MKAGDIVSFKPPKPTKRDSWRAYFYRPSGEFFLKRFEDLSTGLVIQMPDKKRDTILDTGEVLISDVFIQTIIDGRVETVWTNKNDLRVV